MQTYRIVRATNGAALTDEMRQDQRMLLDFAICDELFRAYEQKESRTIVQQEVMRGVTDSLGKALGG